MQENSLKRVHYTRVSYVITRFSISIPIESKTVRNKLCVQSSENLWHREALKFSKYGSSKKCVIGRERAAAKWHWHKLKLMLIRLKLILNNPLTLTRSEAAYFFNVLPNAQLCRA